MRQEELSRSAAAENSSAQDSNTATFGPSMSSISPNSSLPSLIQSPGFTQTGESHQRGNHPKTDDVNSSPAKGAASSRPTGTVFPPPSPIPVSSTSPSPGTPAFGGAATQELHVVTCPVRGEQVSLRLFQHCPKLWSHFGCAATGLQCTYCGTTSSWMV